MLIYVALVSLGDGMNGMRGLAMQNIFKEKFKVEPSDLQKYNSVIAVPIFFRVFFGILIDSKVVKKRKYYVIVVGALSAIPTYFIAIDYSPSPEMMTF